MNRDFDNFVLRSRPLPAGAPFPPTDARARLLARLRELARVAAAFDRVVTGDAAPDARARLAGLGAAHAPERSGSWHAGAAIAAESLLAALAEQGVSVAQRAELAGPGRAEVRERFHRHLLPTLTPLTVDAAHPLRRARLVGLACVATLTPDATTKRAPPRFAVVPMPTPGHRWVRLAAPAGRARFAPVEEVVRLGVSDLYDGEIEACHVVRILRGPAHGPGSPGPARLVEHEPGLPVPILDRLRKELGLARGDLHATDGLLGLGDLGRLCDEAERA